jgi:hypothetical protein
LTNKYFNSGKLAVTSATALYPGQHLFSNPYTGAIDIRQIEFGTSMDAVVYLYNTGMFTQWRDSSSTKIGEMPGSYVAAPKNTAGLAGVPRQVPSMNSMLVRATASNDEAYIYINYDNVVMGNSEKQRVKSTGFEESISSTVIEVKGTNSQDKMWLFSKEEFTRNYDNGSDGRKILGSALNPQIFAVEEDGNYQINAVNDINNSTLAFQAGQETEYELVFTHENSTIRYSKIYLHDMIENSITDITESGSTYQFEAKSSPEPIKRFRIITKKTDSPIENSSDINIFSSKNTLYVQNFGEETGDIYVYDITGRMYYHSKLQENSIHPISVSGQNIFIIKVLTPKEEKVEKIFMNK